MLRNSKRDTKKGDKMQDKWTGTYQVVNEKGVCHLQNLQSQLLLKNGVNVARLKLYYSNRCQEDEKELNVTENDQDTCSSNCCQEDEKELNVAENDQDRNEQV